MTSDQPLLSSSDAPSPLPQPNSGSFNCLCATASFDSSNFEDAQSHIGDLQEDDTAVVANNDVRAVEDSSSSVSTKQFYSAESQLIQKFLLECPPQDGRQLVSWGLMELQENSTAFQIPGLNPMGPEKVNRSQRVRHRSIQFEDVFSHEDTPRLIYVNDPKRTNDKYEFSGNEIRTSKYTLITFLPKNLFIQFHRIAYLYFLAIAALNQLPPLAVFGRTVSLFPLLFVLFVTAIKDGYEDWRRHRSDRNENNREALVSQAGQFQRKKWKKIQVGEIVKICSDETIPCDMVLLGTSDPSGIAYIQTMNLDGESNLKTRYARQETASTDFEGGNISGLIRCEQPNRNIYEFTANMEFNGHKVPLSQSNIILRGCQLKNTDWVIGVVVYAGQETKAMLNSAVSPAKRSKLEGYMNRETLWLSVFLLVMCSVVAIGMGLWLHRHMDELDTLPYYRKRYFTNGPENGKTYKYYGLAMEIFFSFLSSIIVFQIMIPISLYITMELVRLGQSYFMIEDTEMYCSCSDSRFQCRSLNINEDLGQIRYVFSDKTGTLTENKMEFRKASIYGKNYGGSSQSGDHSLQEIQITGLTKNVRKKTKLDIDVDPELLQLLHKELAGSERLIEHEFFLTLAACNTVIPIVSHCQSLSSMGSELHEDVEAIDYQGESPDEQALVAAASAYGYTLIERTSGHIVVDVHGEKLRLDLLGLHEFDSVRKRMSVVIRFPDNSVKVLVKGADSSMLSILSKTTDACGSPEHPFDLRQATENHLSEYSSEGLRTLVLASKNLTDEELEEWQITYEEASTSLSERSVKLRQTAALIESNLNLLGATGVEDKLQDGVPETIESLRQAGIKVWVLTGDKQETAISIGLSCKLLTPTMQQIVINGNSEDECRNLLANAKTKYGITPVDTKLKKNIAKGYVEGHSSVKGPAVGGKEIKLLSGKTYTANAPLALVIDGNSLVYILEKDLEQELFDVATSCMVVLCCRVAPLQKAGIVDLIKSRTNDMTLAIGDGANDVSMIQMADVGVGICGQEGRQAVMASDFAMGQFRFLKKLLLVHGHWNYRRIGYLVLYNFYRNAVFVLMLFWYILCTAFSTTSALTDWSSVLYSVIYTSVPTVVVGIMDKDLSHTTLLRYPKLYGAGHRQESYNFNLFWITMIDTLWQSLVLFYIPLFTYRESDIDIWSMGSLWTIAVVILVNIHLAMDVQQWVLITHLATWGSILITFICMVTLDSIPTFPNYWSIYRLVVTETYWLTIALIMESSLQLVDAPLELRWWHIHGTHAYIKLHGSFQSMSRKRAEQK
ncbi:hypothetical protein H6P81_014636 [Aristolochia fimbriata]|uniref:Phospholipid-transporting ATPase n=1 Tax=Aristolochia fimbriata TaxID=158543 RepID=A0AAV7E659_ARIFI|nr:hypothetical protein H6P81_014636 [Aristolochia fimbriata]